MLNIILENKRYVSHKSGIEYDHNLDNHKEKKN